MNKCEICIHNIVCDHNRFNCDNCGQFKVIASKRKLLYKEHYSSYYKTKYDTRKANHQCVICGCELEEGETKIKCKVCRAISSYSSKKHYQKIKAKGICRKCGVKLPEGTKYASCDICREIERVQAREKRIKK